MKVSKMFRFGMFALLVSTMFIACSEDDGLDEILNGDNSESFFALFDEADEIELECVEFVYPLSLCNADGTTTAINDDAALEQAFINAMNSATPPTLFFPIQVLDDGLTQTISNEEELCDLFEECWEEEDDDDCDCYGDDEPCFEVNYPITLILPDGTQATVNSDEEMETAIDNYYDNNPNDNGDVTLVYPVSVTLIENDSIVTINNDEDLDNIFDLCFDEEFEECFEIQFPLNFSMPDGSTLTANSETELDSLYEAWVQANPNATNEPELILPITVLMLEDNTTVTINTETELEELFNDCYDDICDEIDPDDIIIGKASTTVSRMAAKKQKIRQR